MNVVSAVKGFQRSVILRAARPKPVLTERVFDLALAFGKVDCALLGDTVERHQCCIN